MRTPRSVVALSTAQHWVTPWTQSAQADLQTLTSCDGDDDDDDDDVSLSYPAMSLMITVLFSS